MYVRVCMLLMWNEGKGRVCCGMNQRSGRLTCAPVCVAMTEDAVVVVAITYDDRKECERVLVCCFVYGYDCHRLCLANKSIGRWSPVRTLDRTSTAVSVAAGPLSNSTKHTPLHNASMLLRLLLTLTTWYIYIPQYICRSIHRGV